MRDSEEPAVKLKIETIDRLRLTLGAQEIRITSRKARAVLGYLVLNETPSATREQLVGLLWSEIDDDRARGSLRHCVKELRIAFRGTEFEGLVLGTQSIALVPELVEVDLWQMLAEAKAGRAVSQLLDVAGFTDRLLRDLESVDPGFQGWISVRRLSIWQTLLRNLEDALRQARVDGGFGEELARAIINLDPTHEEACRSLMLIRNHHGDIGGALKAYTSLFKVLEDEHDVEPTDKTQALFAELKARLPLTGGVQEQAAADDRRSVIAVSSTAPAPKDAKLNLSVAPFSAEPVAVDWRYLVNGFRTELIGNLTRFREWNVRDHSPDDDANAEPHQYVLFADAAPAAKGARLWLQLRDRASKDYLWVDAFNLESVDWGEAQQKLVRRIATALNIHVSAGRLAQIGPRPNKDLIAYDLWLKAQTHQLTVEPKGLVLAQSIYRDIISRFPGFAPAYSSLAQIQNSLHFAYPGRFRTPEATTDALRFANTAVKLDPLDSRSQLCLGWANAMSGFHDLAAIHHDIAVDLNPSDAWTLVSAALGSALRNDGASARRLADAAAGASVSSSGIQWRYLAMIRYLIHDFDGCLAAAEKAEHSIQNVFVWKAVALMQLGRCNDAVQAARQFFRSAKSRWLNAETPPTKENITAWFLHAFPFKSGEAWERLRDDFGRAGAPVEGLEFKALCPQSHAHPD